MTPASLSRRIARAFLQRKQAGLPAAVAARTRLHVADAVGIGVAATRDAPWVARLARGLALGEGGSCPTFQAGLALPPAGAAFVNSALVHALDFDDIHDRARLHPTVVTLPAALAASGATPSEGEPVLDAVAVANEFICRLGVAFSPSGTGPGSDWFLTQLFGYLAAALAAGFVWELDEDALVSALGFAYMQAAGGKEAGFGVGSTARSLYPAFAAMAGLQAASMARAGLRGPESALDGAAGLFRIYLGAPLDDAAEASLLEPDGWRFLDTDIKPWPCCRLSHPYVASAFAARAQVGARPVRRLVVAVNASAEKLCRPLDERRRPATLQDAKYSIPFMTAFALSHGRVDLDILDETALADARVLELAACVEIDPRLADHPGHPDAEVEVELEGGARIIGKAMPPRADEAQAREKFARCLAHRGWGNGAQALWARLLAPEAIDARSLAQALERASRA